MQNEEAIYGQSYTLPVPTLSSSSQPLSYRVKGYYNNE